MPQKSCPQCSTKIATAYRKCPKCNWYFAASPKPKKQKTAAEFPSKAPKPAKRKKRKKRKLFEEVDWRTLRCGDIIKSLTGYGPYVMVGENKHYMGHSGLFKVKRLTKDGLLCWSLSEGGFAHLYMTDSVKKMDSGTVMVPHKIKRKLVLQQETQETKEIQKNA